MDGVLEASPWTPSVALGEPAATLQVDLRIYSSPALLRTCYQLSPLAHFALVSGTGEDALVSFFPKASSPNLKALVGQFLEELADQRLRELVAHESTPIRELIVAQALAEGNLLEPEPELPTEKPGAADDTAASHPTGS